MPLLLHLIGRLVAAVLLCLAAAVAWVMFDAHRSIDAETAATAARVSERLESLYWQKLLWRGGWHRDMLVPLPDWETLATASILSPGVCVTFAPPPGDEPRKLCSQIEAVGAPSPAFFAAVSDFIFGPPAPVKRWLTVRDQDAGFVAAAMALAIAMLATLMIGQALIPARTIIDGLRRLQRGDLTLRLPGFRTAEFNLIARAVNDLSAALARTDAARAALTARLFQVQEEERRALARDLHDEFGQCLTATAALAASIEAGAPAERADLAEDARAIARVQKRMMENLRSALTRLRSQDIDEIGLEASLRQLVRDHNMRAAPGAVFRLDVSGPLTAVPKPIAIDIYRIAQEGLTNAVRHGAPTEVKLSVARAGAAGEVCAEAIALTVEDDGGGDAAGIDRRQGHGILGIRERIAARGGSLTIGKAARGLRLSAVIPLIPSGPQPAFGGAPA
jgi:two-component system, NarL family, sensor histidine kinase UhpB